MSRLRTLTVSLPSELAEHVNQVASKEGRSRSKLFRAALRQYLGRQDRWDRIFALGEESPLRTGLDDAGVLKTVKTSRRASPKR